LEKLESIHEKVFKQFNVDLSKPISDKPLKPIGKKLAKNILESLIQKLGGYDKYSIQGRTITILFSTDNEAEEFSDKLASRIIRQISEYIKSIGENPKDYYRVLTISRLVTKNTLTITF
jgi:mRNA-degrading endonuclease RelE of RelBE toxin-antitoxin system